MTKRKFKPPPGDSWKRVVYSAECDEDGNCPVCGEIDYTECDCPGPTQGGIEYEWVDGVLWGRPEPESAA